jgi:hypothetical protein
MSIPAAVIAALSGETSCAGCGCSWADHISDGTDFPSTCYLCLCGQCVLDAGLCGIHPDDYYEDAYRPFPQ